MSYFSSIPNTTYEFDNKSDVVKDICKRSAFISEYRPYTDLYSEYTMTDADTVQSIAYNYYGSAKYYWVIMLFNEFHDINLELPMKQVVFDSYCDAKYGNNKYAVKYYADNETGNAVGEIQEYSDTYVNPEDMSAGNERYTPVTFYDYEISLNESRRIIKLLRPELLSEFVTQFERSMNG